MFTHVSMSGCRDLEDRTGADCRRADVSLMILCCRRVRISYGVLSGWNIESVCNEMKGMCEGETEDYRCWGRQSVALL